MKKIFLTLTLNLFILQAQTVDIMPITNALKAGNADLLKEMMTAEVDIVTPEASKKGNGNDALTLLKAFFRDNKTTGFAVAHHADKNESGFIVGKLTTEKRDFRVNITYTVKDGKILITIIRIE